MYIIIHSFFLHKKHIYTVAVLQTPSNSFKKPITAPSSESLTSLKKTSSSNSKKSFKEEDEGPLGGQSFVFTGVLSTVDRDESEDMVKMHGGKVYIFILKGRVLFFKLLFLFSCSQL